MELEEDEDQYDPLQTRLVRELADVIKGELERQALPPEITRDLTEKLTFAVASVVDGNFDIDLNGVAVKPVLTFESAEEKLVGAGGPSWMHEYAAGAVDAAFGA